MPCALYHAIYLEDAQRGMYEIKEAMAAALKNPLYNDSDPGAIESETTAAPISTTGAATPAGGVGLKEIELLPKGQSNAMDKENRALNIR